MPNPWFRLYSEILDDEKVQMMSFEMQRHLVMLFSLRCQRPTEKMSSQQIAFRLRVSETLLETLHETFLKHGFIAKDWSICNWNKRQFISDCSTDRVKKHRARRENSGLKQDETFQKRDETENETPPEQIQNRTDTEQKHKKPFRAEARFTLPQWINKEAWAGFEEMRKRIRAPMTDRARNGIIRELQKMCIIGDDGSAILDQSTQSSYRGVFPLKESNGSHTNGNGRGFATKGEHNQRVLDDYIRSLEAEDSDGPEASGHDAGRDAGPGSTAALFGAPSKRAS